MKSVIYIVREFVNWVFFSLQQASYEQRGSSRRGRFVILSTKTKQCITHTHTHTHTHTTLLFTESASSISDSEEEDETEVNTAALSELQKATGSPAGGTGGATDPLSKAKQSRGEKKARKVSVGILYMTLYIIIYMYVECIVTATRVNTYWC